MLRLRVSTLRGRKHVGVLLLCAVAATPITSVATLRKIDRQRVIAARLDGKNVETLLIASKPSQNATVVKQLAVLGASVRFREDTVDYLRVKAPVDRIMEIAELPEVEAAAVDGWQMYDTTQELPVIARTQTAAPGINTPPENSFLPAQDIGAPQFIKAHPTFDGRGVTIANLDGDIPDLLAPELQHATTVNGRSIQKLTDVINSLDPEDDASPFRIDMSQQIETHLKRCEIRGATYDVAADGHYRIGFFDIAGFGNLLRPYLPRPEQNDIAILWDEKTNSVWVDTNQNQSFADETPLTDFNATHQAGVLGRDDPTTPMRETVAFIVLTNRERHLVYLAPLNNKHATATASVAAGSRFFGGRMNGVAPGAQIASLLRKSVTHSLIEGMILAVKNPKVDLVSLQWSALMPPQDGNSVVGVVFERLIDKYKKPIFASADNLGPGITTNTEAAAADSVISVGGYVNKRTWHSNFGIVTNAGDALVNLSARGPRIDGGFKPDLVAPALAVSASFGNSSQPPAAFQLPPGYSSGSGTSIACPMASGAAALMISAAKQSGVPYDAERIRWALKSTARYLPGVGAHEQGSGLIDVAAAWEALKRAAAPVRLKSSAQISVASYSPDRGPGIYEREGWRPGQSGRRTITFTRASGKNVPVNYSVRWTGNDGTFKSATSIRLPLHVPVVFPVTIDPRAAGAHSGILNLDEVGGAKSVYQVMNTVVAAEQFTEQENFTITREGTVEYPNYTSYFFNVPPNTSAFNVVANILEGTLRLRFMRPSGKELDQAHDVPIHWLPEYQTHGKLDRVISDPEPGVWQVIVENQSFTAPGELTSDAQRGRFTLTASVFAAQSQSAFTRLSATQTEQTQARFINTYARFNALYAPSPLGSAFSQRLSITQHDEPIIQDLNVPVGSSTLIAHISGQSSPADVDLYLYFCGGDHCELKAYSARPNSEERVIVAQPRAGKWKVVIDPVFVPPSTFTVNYTDLFTHPVFGSLTPSITEATFAAGATSDVNFAVQIDAVPTGNRRIIALLPLLSSEPATTRYEYNATTKKVEAVKEQIRIGAALLEVGPGSTKQKPLTSSTAMQ